MTLAAASPFSCRFCANALVPERAMVPRLSMSSSRDMPMPVSAIVSVFASLFVVIDISIFDPASSPPPPPPVSAAYRRFSSASEAFETSSRTKTSLSVYSELATMLSSLFVSAWNSIDCEDPVDVADGVAFGSSFASAGEVSVDRQRSASASCGDWPCNRLRDSSDGKSAVRGRAKRQSERVAIFLPGHVAASKNSS